MIVKLNNIFESGLLVTFPQLIEVDIYKNIAVIQITRPLVLFDIVYDLFLGSLFN